MTSDEMSAAERIEQCARWIKKELSTVERMFGYMPFLFAALVENGELDLADLKADIRRANKRRQDAPAYLVGTLKRRVENGRICRGVARSLLETFGIVWRESFDEELSAQVQHDTAPHRRRPTDQERPPDRYEIIQAGRKSNATNPQINEVLRRYGFDEIPEYDDNPRAPGTIDRQLDSTRKEFRK